MHLRGCQQLLCCAQVLVVLWQEMKLVVSPRTMAAAESLLSVRGHLRSFTGGSFSMEGGALDPTGTPLRAGRDDSLDSSHVLPRSTFVCASLHHAFVAYR